MKEQTVEMKVSYGQTVIETKPEPNVTSNKYVTGLFVEVAGKKIVIDMEGNVIVDGEMKHNGTLHFAAQQPPEGGYMTVFNREFLKDGREAPRGEAEKMVAFGDQIFKGEPQNSQG